MIIYKKIPLCFAFFVSLLVIAGDDGVHNRHWLPFTELNRKHVVYALIAVGIVGAVCYKFCSKWKNGPKDTKHGDQALERSTYNSTTATQIQPLDGTSKQPEVIYQHSSRSHTKNEYAKPETKHANEATLTVPITNKSEVDLVLIEAKKQKFIERFSLSDEQQKQFEPFKKVICDKAGYRCNNMVKGFRIENKGNITCYNIINAARLARYIENKGYSLVGVPKKYIYIVPERNGIYCVSEKIEPLQDCMYKMSVEQVQQITDIIKYCSYMCLFSELKEHIYLASDKKFFFINTENLAFQLSRTTTYTVLIENLTYFIIEFKSQMSTDALQWITEEMKTMKEKEPITFTHIAFKYELDDPGYSFNEEYISLINKAIRNQYTMIHAQKAL